MNSGFKLEHFELLKVFGGQPWNRSVDQVVARDAMRAPYEATKAWAEALQKRLFPDGESVGRMSVINQGQHFSPYTWWRVYPRKSAPRNLAYTVGIDQSGEFIVKIDTYQPASGVRAAYEKVRGPTNAGSPIARVIAAAEGVKMSFEELVNWSASAVAGFDPHYDELAARIGLSAPKIKLLGDDVETREHFARWRGHLEASAVVKNGVRWVSDGPFVMLVSTMTDGRIRTELGQDPLGKSWAVEINEPRVAGDPNSASGIGLDLNGRPYLLRQGLLRKNAQSDAYISSEDFAIRTGLQPLNVEAPASLIERDWFLVAALDEEPSLVRAMTARFINACMAARDPSSSLADSPPVNHYRLAADEKGGSYVIGPGGPRDESIVVRKHGFVWLSLKERLSRRGIQIEKPAHWLGYEADASIKRPGERSLLLEIKTSASAADIHAGVGQLHLYRSLIPTLEHHEAILLLPKLPHEEIVRALGKAQIAVHTYAPPLDPERGDVAFSEPFLAVCRAL